MQINDIYEVCPEYQHNNITLRQTNIEDAVELLKCYSDEKAVPFFNSDNCHGDDFHYTAIEKMKQAIDFWDVSYKSKHFVRWTVILKDTDEKIGTIEMFHRVADDDFNHYGILRIDLHSTYETTSIISEILEIANNNFFKSFDVEAILSKAVPNAQERTKALSQNGYVPTEKKLMIYDDYFVKFLKK